MLQEAERRVVHPMGILEDEQRRHHEHTYEELLDHGVQARAPERRIDLVALRRRRDLSLERDREQWQQRREIGDHRLDPRLEARTGIGGRELVGDPCECPQDTAEGVERCRRPVLIAMTDQLREARGQLACLGHEARLADPRLADELDRVRRPHARAFDGGEQGGELRVSSDDRELALGRGGGGPDGFGHAVSGDRALLALHQKRLWLDGVARVGAIEHLGGGEDLPRPGTGGEARSQVDHVPQHCVGPAGRGAHVAGERRPAVDAGAQHQRARLVDEGAQGSKHSLLVRAGGERRTRRQVELAAVRVDVGLEPRDRQLRRHLADQRSECSKRCGDAVDAVE